MSAEREKPMADAEVISAAVLVGLVLSLGGDVALMFEGRKPFTLGLGLFLLAHVAYTAVFGYLGRFSGCVRPSWPTSS